MIRLIYLCGRRASGKDTTASAIINSFPHWKRGAFADAMKDMFAQQYGVPRWELDDTVMKEKHRAELIAYAERERAIDPRIFVRKLQERVVDENWTHGIITDMRRPPELEWALAMKGSTVIKIFADEPTRASRGVIYDPKVDESDTETFMDKPDQYFYSIGGAVVDNSNRKCLAGQLKILGGYYQWAA